MALTGKTIALCVSGSIAAYKACELTSRFKKLGANVHVVLTKNALEFVAPLALETLSNNKVIVDQFEKNFEHEVGHITLAKKADVFLVAPATANVIAKYANGIADDYLSTTLMATLKPVIIAPAMNTNMLNSFSTQNNIAFLKKNNVKFIESQSGLLACGDVGNGRLASVDSIVEYIMDLLLNQDIDNKQDYKGKTVLITAGATKEPIDPVRYITNHSSGKMGYAIANAVFKRGGNVIFIHGDIYKVPSNLWTNIHVDTTQDMYNAVMANVNNVDIIIKSAAPADYSPSIVGKSKIKDNEFSLSFTKNVDIAKAVGAVKGDKKLVVFAAETNDLIKNAKQKLKNKNADIMVANDVTKKGAGFNTDTNIVTIITPKTNVESGLKSKDEIANLILDEVLKLD